MINKITYKNCIGKICDSKYYGKFKIIEYFDRFNVKIMFLDTKTIQLTTLGNIRNGNIRDRSKKKYNKYSKERNEKFKQKFEGQIFVNNQGSKYKIIKYYNSRNILIEFCDKHKYQIKTELTNIQTKNIKNPYFPFVKNIGYLGKIDFYMHKEMKKYIYAIWFNMLTRCYDKKIQQKSRNKSYQNCTVCEEWHNFTNFYNWIIKQENYNKLKTEHLQIDKDILLKGNKIYSPKNCCLVSKNVNVLFTNRKKMRGKYLIGVINKNNNKFRSCIRKNNKTIHLGYFTTEQEAFNCYKEAKEQHIKEVAEQEYKKGNITKKCYEAMLKYKIEKKD